jgi:tripartite-type tricarboxylate transporter receptor subunit TctC
MAPASSTRRVLCAGIAGLFAGAPMFAAAQSAANYPNKPIRIVVAASPGGTSDILARTIGQKMTEKWNQAVVVESKPGADSNVGADYVAKSPADGYTLLLLDVSTLTMGPSLYPKLTYNPRTDFAPVTTIVFSPHALTAFGGLPASNLKDLIAYSKANPGKLNFASSSNATRLAAARLNLATGMDMQIVPYKGGAQAMTAIAGGESNVTMASLLSTIPHLKNGRIKPIAVASERRMQAEPNIPTIQEGGVRDFVTGSHQGLLAPAGTPPEIVRKLNAVVVEILRSPEVSAKLAGQGAEVVADTPEQFGAFLREETDKWSRVVKEANIRIE